MSEFDTQYEEEEKLLHTVLSNIKFYDEAEDSFCDAMLELFGHCTKTTTYESNGETWKGIRTISLGDSEIEVSVIRRDGRNVTVGINNNRYIMDISNLDILTAYYNELNKDYINLRNNFKYKIISITLDLLKNESIAKLLSNYIEQISFHFFMNYKLIAGFESRLEDENDIGKMLFISTEQLRSSLKKTTQHKEGKTTKVFEHLENGDLINNYKEQSFDLLVDFLTEELDIQENNPVAKYLTYKLLLEASKRYFANTWQKEYGNYFTDINKLSLFDATDIYCSIESINTKDLESAGAFIYYLMLNDKFDSDNYLDCYEIILDIIEECEKRNKVKLFGKLMRKGKSSISISIDAVDIMDGNEFEHFVANLFIKMGYNTTVTKASGDQGIDVIAEKGDRKLGIQAKCYSSGITNKAIQEVVAGLAHYKLDKGIVVTNNYFTDSARKLAESNGIILWDRTMLKEKIVELF